MESLISERIGTNKLFPEEDLIALLNGVGSALEFLQEKNISHGDINPRNIYFDIKVGVFKIYDSELLEGYAASYN